MKASPVGKEKRLKVWMHKATRMQCSYIDENRPNP